MTTDAQKAQVHQMAEAIRRLMAEIARLAATDLPPETFFKEFIVRAVRAIDAAGGAVWIRSARRLDLVAEVHFASSRYSDDPRQAQAIRAALAWVERHGRSVIIAPLAQDWPDDGPPEGISNYTSMPFFLVPIMAAERVAGVVQLWLPPGRDPKHYRHFMEFLIKVAQYAESFVHRELSDQAARRTQAMLESLARQVGPDGGQLRRREAPPLRRAALWLAKLPSCCRRKGWIVAPCLAVGLFVAALVPVGRSIEGPCAVWPATRAAIVPQDQGAVAAVFVTAGQQVQPGQALLSLDNPALAASAEAARREVERWRAEAQAREAAGDATGARSAATEAESADAQLKHLERRLALLTLRATAAGTIVAPDLPTLLGRQLAPGDHIMDIADTGTWLVRIELPEKNFAQVQQAVAEAADRGGAQVDFVLAAQPQKNFLARLASSAPLSPDGRSGAEGAAVVLCATVDPAALAGPDASTASWAGPDAPTASWAGAEFHPGDEGRARIHLVRQTIARRLLDALFE